MSDSGENIKLIKERLTKLAQYLAENSAFDGDNNSWAAKCIETYLSADPEKTLDHAFGIRSSKRGRPPGKAETHDEWVTNAFIEVLKSTSPGKKWPSTKELARIGRYYGLGGRDNANAEDSGIASDLKNILETYQSIIVKQLSEELTAKMKKAE